MPAITVDAGVLRTCLDKSVETRGMTWGCQLGGDARVLTVETDEAGLSTLTIILPGEAFTTEREP